MPSDSYAFLASRMDPARVELRELRRRVYEVGRELGRPVWVAGCGPCKVESEDPLGIQLECLARVRRAREVICILDGSYGTPWNQAELCVLELEIVTAALARKPLRVFLLAPFESDPRMQTLIAAARVAGAAGTELAPRSGDQIERSIREHLSRRPGRLQCLAAFLRGGAPLDPDARQLDVSFLDGIFTPLRPGPPDDHLVRQLLLHAGAMPHLPTQLVYAWMAIRHLCAAPYDNPVHANRLPLWDAALTRWSSAAAWYGLHGHLSMGRLAAVNTLRWIRGRRSSAAVAPDAPGAIQGSLGGLASEYYSIAKRVRSRSLRKGLFEKALACVEEALRSGPVDPSGLIAIRGSILRHLGRRREALRCFHEMLRLRQARHDDPGRIGEAEVELGMGYLFVGDPGTALRLVQRGVARLEGSERHGFTVRALRDLAIVQLVTLQPWWAYRTVARAYRLARKYEVDGALAWMRPVFAILQWFDPSCSDDARSRQPTATRQGTRSAVAEPVG